MAVMRTERARRIVFFLALTALAGCDLFADFDRGIIPLPEAGSDVVEEPQPDGGDAAEDSQGDGAAPGADAESGTDAATD